MRARSHIVIFSPRENEEPLLPLLLLDVRSPRGRRRKGNGKFSLATERPCRRCNHRRCTARFYRRAFQLNSRQMCLRSAAGKVLGRKIYPNPSTSGGRQQTKDCSLPFISVYFVYCHRLHVRCAKRPPRGRLTTRSTAGARTCQPRNCTCCVSASACLPTCLKLKPC